MPPLWPREVLDVSDNVQTIREALDRIENYLRDGLTAEPGAMGEILGTALSDLSLIREPLDRLVREREEMLVDMTVLDAELTHAERERDEALEALREKVRNALYFLGNDPEAARLELLAAQRALAYREARWSVLLSPYDRTEEGDVKDERSH
jgi:hypothetical protein